MSVDGGSETAAAARAKRSAKKKAGNGDVPRARAVVGFLPSRAAGLGAHARAAFFSSRGAGDSSAPLWVACTALPLQWEMVILSISLSVGPIHLGPESGTFSSYWARLHMLLRAPKLNVH